MASKGFKWTGLSKFSCRPVVKVVPNSDNFLVQVLHPNTGEKVYEKSLKKKDLSSTKVSESDYLSLAIKYGNDIASTLKLKTEEQKPVSVYGKKKVKRG